MRAFVGATRHLRIPTWPLLQRSNLTAQTLCVALPLLRSPRVALCTTAKLDTRKLNGILSGATRARELLRLHNEHSQIFDRVSFGTCWSRLGRVSIADRKWLQSNDGAPQLLALREKTRRQLPSLQPRHVSNVAHALAKLDFRGAAWTSLSKELEGRRWRVCASSIRRAFPT